MVRSAPTSVSESRRQQLAVGLGRRPRDKTTISKNRRLTRAYLSAQNSAPMFVTDAVMLTTRRIPGELCSTQNLALAGDLLIGIGTLGLVVLRPGAVTA